MGFDPRTFTPAPTGPDSLCQPDDHTGLARRQSNRTKQHSAGRRARLTRDGVEEDEVFKVGDLASLPALGHGGSLEQLLGGGQRDPPGKKHTHTHTHTHFNQRTSEAFISNSFMSYSVI